MKYLIISGLIAVLMIAGAASSVFAEEGCGCAPCECAPCKC